MINKIEAYEIFCEARNKENYYKGEILPFVNKLCRRNMTSGDIDGFVWDYKKKIYIVIEQKWSTERQKDSQDLHLEFINAILNEAKKQERFADWSFYVFKIVGDPPFHTAHVINIDTKETRKIDRRNLIHLLEMNIKFEELS